MSRVDNQYRKNILRTYADLYCPNDYDILVSRMPINEDDADGTGFDDYFDMVQALFGLQGDPSVDRATLLHLRMACLKYKFPLQQIDALLAVKDKDDSTQHIQ